MSLNKKKREEREGDRDKYKKVPKNKIKTMCAQVYKPKHGQ